MYSSPDRFIIIIFTTDRLEQQSPHVLFQTAPFPNPQRRPTQKQHERPDEHETKDTQRGRMPRERRQQCRVMRIIFTIVVRVVGEEA